MCLCLSLEKKVISLLLIYLHIMNSLSGLKNIAVTVSKFLSLKVVEVSFGQLLTSLSVLAKNFISLILSCYHEHEITY